MAELSYRATGLGLVNEHDIRKRTDLSHGAVQLECNCGFTAFGLTLVEAEGRHQAHYAKVTVHEPGLADARRALEGGDDAA